MNPQLPKPPGHRPPGRADQFKQGDQVQWVFLGKTGDLGEVLRVFPCKRLGGVKAVLEVRWRNGYVGRVEDRKVRKIVEIAK